MAFLLASAPSGGIWKASNQAVWSSSQATLHLAYQDLFPPSSVQPENGGNNEEPARMMMGFWQKKTVYIGILPV
jgi:hypothetical protein